MKKYLIVCLATILCVNSFLKASAQLKASELSAQMDVIFKKYDNNSGPGCAVAIIQNGRALFNKGYGLANLEYAIPIKTTTTFDIASLSKQFTGLAISMLVQEKKIALGEDIHHYLPQRI